MSQDLTDEQQKVLDQTADMKDSPEGGGIRVPESVQRNLDERNEVSGEDAAEGSDEVTATDQGEQSEGGVSANAETSDNTAALYKGLTKQLAKAAEKRMASPGKDVDDPDRIIESHRRVKPGEARMPRKMQIAKKRMTAGNF